MWQPNKFLIADSWSPDRHHEVYGYTYRGLGIHMILDGSPKGRRPPTWGLKHLGSGHGVCWIKGKVSVAFVIAGEIADCGDWQAFDGLTGWANTDPELPAKLKAIMNRYPKATGRGGGNHDDEAARAIAIARA